MADVGHGLCLGILTLEDSVIVVDCGDSSDGKEAADGFIRIANEFGNPNAFILSHYHADHYRGLCHPSLRNHPPKFPVQDVYYPILPKFPSGKQALRREFGLAIMALNRLMLGDRTGSVQYDLLDAVREISSSKLSKHPLVKGSHIKLGSSDFEVVWPPSLLDDGWALRKVTRAVEDFRRALESDPRLQDIYASVNREGEFEDTFGGTFDEGHPSDNQRAQASSVSTEGKLPPLVRKANESLKNAANHISLAFCEDNRLLFMGDLERPEIKRVVADLVNHGGDFFEVFVSPHHGTHWHNNLSKLHFMYSLTSNGKDDSLSNVERYKLISRKPLSTWVNGNIIASTGYRGVWPIRSLYDYERVLDAI